MNTESFESRKADHLRLSLNPAMQASESGFDKIQLRHEALPEIQFENIQLKTKFWKHQAASPCFISSMTAGHHKGESLNITLAKAASENAWPMGVGSQRRELSDPQAKEEWKRLRKQAPHAMLFSNIGLSQLIQSPVTQILRLTESLEAIALIVHTNPLQEALQIEGTPQFQGGVKALEKLCKISSLPIILKETGCGFSLQTLQRLKNIGLSAIDISGKGGTHWGRIEGHRAPTQSPQYLASQVFAQWGESTVNSLLHAASLKGKKNSLEIWSSGGIRSGLDAAISIALGAQKVGFAKPALEHAVQGEEVLSKWMKQMEYELKIALFCTGSKNPEALRKGKKWQKI